jgi:hypothetical protein
MDNSVVPATRPTDNDTSLSYRVANIDVKAATGADEAITIATTIAPLSGLTTINARSTSNGITISLRNAARYACIDVKTVLNFDCAK